MDVCLDMGSPYYGRIPVTPIMDFQLDNITVNYLLMPWKSKILKELQKKILSNRKEEWLEVHLTLFIILNNVERQVRHDNWFARRYGMGVRDLETCAGKMHVHMLTNGIASVFQLQAYRNDLFWRKDTTRAFPSCQQGSYAFQLNLGDKFPWLIFKGQWKGPIWQ